mmetsp:Transcript_8279/g.13101  ORF Transcript_8279/g.13101 Transcript_8279/m.13101 type:complete len:297 (+) Transcript_8279:48-938(+)|eukprot:CAMPEP_0179456594 /NCGR_PEP_ID=MMETSP0799-20121207/40486_1 /TAXON_ID=46947 /ORGANISM="Geminigera cryophila, Strain CCMP2564" /LENGTH=296 /DNA_ID=CAMNT_0021256685 /DNA_START=16 /DNA_END=906 /DNA_ORIENTATION=+
MPKEEEDDNLYFKIYGAGVIFVVLSLSFQGCLFYTCSSGHSNFGSSLRAGISPKDGKFLGIFNETWQCEDACITRIPPCRSFTFLTYGADKDPLNGQCYGGSSPSWDPIEMTRKTGGSAISGALSTFATMCAPVATAASANGAPIGKIVGTVTEVRSAVKVWPLFAAFGNQLERLDAQSRSDLWGLLYVLLLSWPLLHQILVDRSNYINRLSGASEETQDTAAPNTASVSAPPKNATDKKASSADSPQADAARLDILGVELPHIEMPDIGKEVNNLISWVSPKSSPEKGSKESARK